MGTRIAKGRWVMLCSSISRLASSRGALLIVGILASSSSTAGPGGTLPCSPAVSPSLPLSSTTEASFAATVFVCSSSSLTSASILKDNAKRPLARHASQPLKKLHPTTQAVDVTLPLKIRGLFPSPRSQTMPPTSAENHMAPKIQMTSVAHFGDRVQRPANVSNLVLDHCIATIVEDYSSASALPCSARTLRWQT